MYRGIAVLAVEEGAHTLLPQERLHRFKVGQCGARILWR